MESKPFKLLLNLLYIMLALLFIVLPVIFSIQGGDFEGIAFPMLPVGIWLLLFGKMKIANLRLEGKQAFAVGGALVLPFLAMTAQHQLNLWFPLRWISIVVGLILAVVLYFVVEPTTLSKSRYPFLGVLGASLLFFMIGSGMGDVSVGPYLESAGLLGILGGIFGLIFGSSQKDQ